MAGIYLKCRTGYVRLNTYTPPNKRLSKAPYNPDGITPPGDITDTLMKTSYLADDEHTAGLNVNKGSKVIYIYDWQALCATYEPLLKLSLL